MPLKPGQVAFTTAGRGESRGFTGVIHAYGPRWTSPVDKESLHKGKKQVPMNGEEQTLVRTWENILTMADEYGDNRLAAPLISSGLFGYPFQDCAETTFETILRTPTRVTHVHIRTVSRRSFDQLVEARNRVLRKLDIA
jgi:O-acetyl-ADP-ribose deacetylase (regulator of RNase III)